MKITQKKLQQIIKEEVAQLIKEQIMGANDKPNKYWGGRHYNKPWPGRFEPKNAPVKTWGRTVDSFGDEVRRDQYSDANKRLCAYADELDLDKPEITRTRSSDFRANLRRPYALQLDPRRKNLDDVIDFKGPNKDNLPKTANTTCPG